MSIVAHARSGASDHAWRLFREGGFDGVDDDAAVLSVKGRLLKDRALSSDGDARKAWYLEAADAYSRAGMLGTATYPLINAASLSLLAGEPNQAQALARLVLERLDRGEGEPDTPYWRGATRAEAMLLLGHGEEARGALEQAIARSSRAWEDHASTLRQFALILDALGHDKAWLDPLRPPRAAHFAGHMGLAPDTAAIRAKVDALLREENIGFGYGALAAGADIVFAEALLARGAELHVVLPGALADFRAASVARVGPEWAERFDAVLKRADTVRSIDQPEGAAHPLAVRLAAEVAMGAAVMQANALMTGAIQLLLLDSADPSEASGSCDLGGIWRRSGRPQRVVTGPRQKARAAPTKAPAEAAPPALAALLTVDLSAADTPAKLAEAAIPALAQAVASAPKPLEPPRWSADASLLRLAYADPTEAAQAALAIARALEPIAPARIAGHYGLARRLPDPFGGPDLWMGPAASLTAKVLDSVPPGAAHVTDDFAAALHAGPAEHRPRTEYVGDLPPEDPGEEMRLFSLKR
ncbi:MAG: hypothetical protein JSR45_15840 [Proteobacteria bacterium]|nr:hypothetical protein [Pseudomonadota bacterium]